MYSQWAPPLQISKDPADCIAVVNAAPCSRRSEIAIQEAVNVIRDEKYDESKHRRLYTDVPSRC